MGLASTVVYAGGGFGWCGNIVVREDYRRRGLASLVLRAALDSLGDSVDTSFLDASDMGMPLYAKAGFVPVSRVRRYYLPRQAVDESLVLSLAAPGHEHAAAAAMERAEAAVEGVEAAAGVAWSPAPPPLRVVKWPEEAAAVTAMDAGVFGADRGNLLASWRGRTVIARRAMHRVLHPRFAGCMTAYDVASSMFRL